MFHNPQSSPALTCGTFTVGQSDPPQNPHFSRIICTSASEDPPLTLIERVDHILCGSVRSAETSQAQRSLETKRERIACLGTLRPAWKGNGLLPMDGRR